MVVWNGTIPYGMVVPYHPSGWFVDSFSVAGRVGGICKIQSMTEVTHWPTRQNLHLSCRGQDSLEGLLPPFLGPNNASLFTLFLFGELRPSQKKPKTHKIHLEPCERPLYKRPCWELAKAIAVRPKRLWPRYVCAKAPSSSRIARR